MIRAIAISAFALMTLTRCASVDLPTKIPAAVTGETASSKFSGWVADGCSHGEPVKEPKRECVTVDGEIYIVRVKNGISLIDGSSLPAFDVLVPAPVDGTAPHQIELVIEPAPPKLAADTGVRLWAKRFSFANFECPGDGQPPLSASCLDKLIQRYRLEP